MLPEETADKQQEILCTPDYCMKSDAEELHVLDLSNMEVEDPATRERIKKAIDLFLNNEDEANVR